jgi:hypothetical protein
MLTSHLQVLSLRRHRHGSTYFLHNAVVVLARGPRLCLPSSRPLLRWYLDPL